MALAKQNRQAEAMAAFEQAIQLDPDHGWAHYNLGYLYLQLASLDVAIALLDTSTGEKVFIAEANAAGLGGDETLSMTLPVPGPAMGVYAISIMTVTGSGTYQAAFSASPVIGFFLDAGWQVNGVLGEQMALFYVVSTLGKAGQAIHIEAVPRTADNLDLAITAVDSTADQNLGTLDESGPGEIEGDSFIADSSVYIFIVSDQAGQPGHLVMKSEH